PFVLEGFATFPTPALNWPAPPDVPPPQPDSSSGNVAVAAIAAMMRFLLIVDDAPFSRGLGLKTADRVGSSRPRIECVTQAVAEEVERQHGDEDGHTRHDHEFRIDLVVVRRVRKHAAPARRPRAHAHAD